MELHRSGAVWESRWTSWAVRPNEPSGFRGRKAILNHASAAVGLSLSLICQLTSEDIKQHYLPTYLGACGRWRGCDVIKQCLTGARQATQSLCKVNCFLFWTALFRTLMPRWNHSNNNNNNHDQKAVDKFSYDYTVGKTKQTTTQKTNHTHSISLPPSLSLSLTHTHTRTHARTRLWKKKARCPKVLVFGKGIWRFSCQAKFFGWKVDN